MSPHGENDDLREEVRLFHAAFGHKIEVVGVKQIDVAESDKVSVTYQYLNKIYKRRRGGSARVQHEIADYFGMTYRDFLRYGEIVEQGGDPEAEMRPPEKIIAELPPDDGQISDEAWSSTELLKATAADLTALVEGQVQNVRRKQEDCMASMSQMANRLSSLVEERNRLLAMGEDVNSLTDDYSSYLEAFDCAIMVINTDLKIIYTNTAAIEFVGSPVLGVEWDAIAGLYYKGYDPDDSTVKKALQNNRRQTVVKEVKGRMCQFKLTPLVSPSGIPKAIMLELRDYHEAYSRIRRTQAMLDSMDDLGLMLFDADRNLLRVNKTALEMTGTTEATLKTFEDVQMVVAGLKNGANALKRIHDVFITRQEQVGSCLPVSRPPLDQFLTPLFDEDEEFIGVLCRIRYKKEEGGN